MTEINLKFPYILLVLPIHYFSYKKIKISSLIKNDHIFLKKSRPYLP